jgi:uncharacterized pyridoxamine 5'-phosphate oxidase family protein
MTNYIFVIIKIIITNYNDKLYFCDNNKLYFCDNNKLYFCDNNEL